MLPSVSARKEFIICVKYQADNPCLRDITHPRSILCMVSRYLLSDQHTKLTVKVRGQGQMSPTTN